MTRTRWTRRRLLPILGLIIAVTVSSAWAYWAADSTPGGNGAAGASAVNRGATPTATVSSNTVTVSWAAGTMSGNRPVTGYTVKRYDAATRTSQTMLSACATTVSAQTCVESKVPPGQWLYSVTPVRGNSWRGGESAMSATATVLPPDGTAPVNAVSLSNVTGSAVQSGNTIYYRGAAAGSFTLSNAVTDAESGPASSTTGALGGTSTGWTHSPSTVSTPSSGPYVSRSFSWAAGTTSAPTETVTGRDLAGNTVTTTLTFVDDSAAPPAAGTVTYADGYQPNLSVSVTHTSVTDSGSGIAARQLQRSSAPLADGLCGPFSGFANVGPTNPESPFVDTHVANSTCYQYQLMVTDRVGNRGIATSDNVAMVDYAGAVGATTGLLSQWRLGETATALDASDTFTGAAGSTLNTHAAETGGTWQRLPASNGTEKISREGDAYRDGTGFNAPYLPATPPTVDYTVEADLVVRSNLAGDQAGVTARLNTAVPDTFYAARWEQPDTSWNIVRYVNGVQTYLQFSVAQPALSADSTNRIRLEVTGDGTTTTLNLYVNGTLKVGPVTDTTASLQTAGKAGIMDGEYGGSVVKTATTGVHFDNFQVASRSRAADSRGTNTGDYVNGVTLGLTGALAGDRNTAARFDGVDDYVQVLGSNGIPVGSSVRSVEMWFRTTSPAQQALYSYGSLGEAQAFGLWLNSGGSAMTAWGWGANNDKTFTMPTALNDGAWHQVVETYDGTSITIYIDGVALAPQAATRSTVMDASGFGIGAVLTPGDVNSGRYFAGELDEVSLYTTVLAPSTVDSHHAVGRTSGTPETSDVTGPQGGSVDANGLVGTGSRYSTSTTLNLVFAEGTDPSGVADSGSLLQRSAGTLTAGACTNFGGYVLVVGGADPASPKSDTVGDQACYRYQFLVPDTLGNYTTYTSRDIKVSTSSPAAPSLAFSGLTNSTYASGTLTYVANSTTGGSFTTTATTTSGAGAASYTFSSAGTSWTSTAGALGVNTYSWPGPGAPATNAALTVTVTDNAGRTSPPRTVTLTADVLDPPATFTFTRDCTLGVATSPAFKAEATAVGGLTASSVTVPVPAGTVQGDLLIAGVIVDVDGYAVSTPAPTGWTVAAASQSNGGASRTTTFWRFAPASPPRSYAFAFSLPTNGSAGFMGSYTGADPTSPVAVAGSQANGASTSVTAPGLIAGTAPTTLVTVMGVDNAAAIVPTTPTNMTLRGMAITTFDGGDRDRILHADEARPSAGPTNVRTSSLGASSRASVGVSLILRSAVTADPKIDLSWTATPDPYATGYEISRAGGPTTSVPGRTTLTWSDTSTIAASAYTYTITAVYGTSRSATRTVVVPPC